MFFCIHSIFIRLEKQIEYPSPSSITVWFDLHTMGIVSSGEWGRIDLRIGVRILFYTGPDRQIKSYIGVDEEKHLYEAVLHFQESRSQSATALML